MQEVLHAQLNNIVEGLNAKDQEWDFIGVGRDDGATAGEYSPIFYRPGVWELLKFKTVWLSKTPDKPSKSWDAACIRILTVGLFKHRVSKQRVLAFNTHLDDRGSWSRLEAVRIICHQAVIESTGDKQDPYPIPTFLAGDLNSKPNDEAYAEITTRSAFHDTRLLLEQADRYGHQNTYTGFGFQNEPPSRIDFIFVDIDIDESQRNSHEYTEAPRWRVMNHAVLESRFDDGVYCSDHRAVVADLLLQQQYNHAVNDSLTHSLTSQTN
ncbi:hypothetical protein MMC09_006154 [Bachmanniomyces sp. S44760]|nr:hypothetical protein [Bachmanniomyces sp. S44760]